MLLSPSFLAPLDGLERNEEEMPKVQGWKSGSMFYRLVAALAGTAFPSIEQGRPTPGFDDIACEFTDAVSDRDFAIEFCHTASLLMMHLSRWSEELVLGPHRS